MKRTPPKDIRALLPVEPIESRNDLYRRIALRNEIILALVLYSVGMTLAFLVVCELR